MPSVEPTVLLLFVCKAIFDSWSVVGSFFFFFKIIENANLYQLFFICRSKAFCKTSKNLLTSHVIVVNSAGDFGDTCNNLRVLYYKTGTMV